MWEVLILWKGASARQMIQTAGGKSVNVVIAPTCAGEAEQIKVRRPAQEKQPELRSTVRHCLCHSEPLAFNFELRIKGNLFPVNS
jgi:hypothetical protein